MPKKPSFHIPALSGTLSVDGTQGVSLYVQVANILRYGILSGSLPPGQRLPTVVELAEHFKVSRITIREALRVLGEEGLLTSSRGRGSHVLEHPRQGKPTPEIADAMSSDATGLEIVVLGVEDVHVVPPEMLGDAIAFPAYKGITKIHKHQGRPLGLMQICIADSIYRRLPKGAIEKKKILPMVEKLSDGPELKFTITVEPADVALVEQLGCPLGSPIARILRRLVDSSNRGVYLSLSWYRGDTFSLTASIPNALLPQVPTSIVGKV